MQDIFIGVDVSMDWLDLHQPCRGERRVANGGRELTAFARRAARQLSVAVATVPPRITRSKSVMALIPAFRPDGLRRSAR
jgi:hypothetical protein